MKANKEEEMATDNTKRPKLPLLRSRPGGFHPINSCCLRLEGILNFFLIKVKNHDFEFQEVIRKYRKSYIPASQTYARALT